MSALAEAKALLAAGSPEQAAEALREAIPALDYVEQSSAARLAEKLAGAPALSGKLFAVRVAVLGSSTTAQLLPLLQLHCFRNGLRAEFYDAGFDTYPQEILNPASGLYAFKPQVALLFVNYRDARPGPVEAEADRWRSLLETLTARAGCAVVMNNFDAPVERPLGNLDARPEFGLGRLRRLNALLAERLPPGAVLLDQEHLSSVVGKERWHDARFWHHSRQAISFDALPRYAAEAADLIRGALGRSRKCLVLDLDNTLWGGVVGDDGAEKLDLGEAYLDFQRYLKALKQRGILLAVCSKNEEATAREPFLTRPEMVLKLEDFAAFAANWNDKASNLRAIAATLSIGVDALAFADDNPAECALVRRLAPEVAVVALPEDPAAFVRALDARRLFETAALSSEDAARTAHFHAEKIRDDLRKNASDLQGFLTDLKMIATAAPFAEPDVPRLAQLANKTNQFNLTTRRTTEPEVRALMADPKAVTLSVRLKDRLGDYGLISLAVARESGEILEIENWLMSCRVLGREVEKLVFNRLLAAARERGLRALLGRCLPTAKNAPVQDLLPRLGFRAQDDGGWRLDVAGAKTFEIPISEES